VVGCRLGPVFTRAEPPRWGSYPGGRCPVLVESAGVDAANRWVPGALGAGWDVVLCSCAVLADPRFVAALAPAPGRLLVPPGAIGGLDLFRAATRGSRTSTVRLTTTKRAEALSRQVVRAEQIFTGSARQAALAFPKTANVAVALAMATVGLDRTEVVVVADPLATRTRHVVEFTCDLGSYRFEAENELAPGSEGRTSAVTGWSVVTVLEDLAADRGVGGALQPLTATS
jgi:aspartate dehydrogenase